MTDAYSEHIEPPLHQQLSRIDAPMERKRVGDMVVNRFAGLTITEYREAIEFAKVMATGRNSIPGYLKGNNGDCLAVVTQSLRWRLEPYWVAQHSYVARAESIITYDAAVHAAIVLSSGLLKSRPRYYYDGTGEDRICTVSATFIGETEPLSYTTPPIKQCRPPKNEQGVVRGSPLWIKDPDQQLGYYAIRNWGRRHCPEVLGGVYDREEFEETSQDETPVLPPSPNLMSRLPGKMEGAGFQTDVVDQGLAEEAKKLAEDAKAAKAQAKAESTATVAVQAAQAAPESPAPTQAAPEPEKPVQTPPELKAPGEYQVYAERWIQKASNPDDIEARWDGEQGMRALCKVPVAMRKRLEASMNERLRELRKTK